VIALAVAILSTLVGPAGAPSAGPAGGPEPPRVTVWTDRGEDPYAGGQGARVAFRSAVDAYVTILRVDTDGRVRVLFPREPWQDNFVRGGRVYAVTGGGPDDEAAFYVDDYPGVGYLFAVGAADPFIYSAIARGDQWDYRVIADGRVRGDPYVALTDVARRIVPEGYRDWDYDLVPYYVQRHYDYPRFLCYDCHSYVSYPFWPAYDFSCPRFRIEMYDDPDYYPYRVYGGTRVVFTRSLQPEPRFVFRDRRGAEPFVTRLRQRPATGAGPREGGLRARDGAASRRVPPSLRGRPTAPPGAVDQRHGGRVDDRPSARPGPRIGPDRRARPQSGDAGSRSRGVERPDRPDRAPRDGGGRRSEPPPRPEPRRDTRPSLRPPAAAPPPPAPSASRGESRRDRSRPSRGDTAPKPRKP